MCRLWLLARVQLRVAGGAGGLEVWIRIAGGCAN